MSKMRASTLLIIVLVFVSSCREDMGERKDLPILNSPGPAIGEVVVSLLNPGEASSTSPLHTTSFVNGTAYQGMEDNDLRGFLDGLYKYAWNQPTQAHVRLGRRGRSPRYGEHELFRVLQRWDRIILPPGSEVVSAELTLHVEEGNGLGGHVMLYRVNRDWQPGGGGALRDNLSPPRKGEVWWDDRAFPDEPWGLPGAGYASDDDPEADTAQSALAMAPYERDTEALVFSSHELSDYVRTRVAEGLPLLFLLKLSDMEEDYPGSLMEVYSGNHGDEKESVLRPRLTLRWRSTGQIREHQVGVKLEYGRWKIVGPFRAEGAFHLALSFLAAESSGPLAIWIRGGKDSGTAGPWSRFSVPLSLDWDWFELRLLSAEDPLPLGAPFHSTLRNTWIRTGPPAKQEVKWTFLSPSGKRYEKMAGYQGQYIWEIRFVPDEVGPWEYFWEEKFTDHPYRSPLRRFYVFADAIGDVEDSLDQFLQDLEGAPGEVDFSHYIRFNLLERAALYLLTPEVFRSREGREIRDRLRAVRRVLGETEIPQNLPLEPDSPAKWMREGE